MKTVAVIEGFAGGPMHTRHFKKALSEAGFIPIKSRVEADIIIAHSAGIYAIPQEAKAKLMVLIGPTYWPGKLLPKRSFAHTRSSGKYHLTNFGLRYYVWKKLLEIYYFFRRHEYLWLGIIHNNKLDRIYALADKPGREIIVIRNQDDPFTTPKIANQLKHRSIKFIELPGVHDHFLRNPQPYIDLLLKAI
jgi:hypothetical protein